MNKMIYRVRTRITSSLQPGCGATHWNTDNVLYVGTDRDAARLAYHASAPKDYGSAYGNRSRETVMEVIEDAGTQDAADDAIGAIAAD